MCCFASSGPFASKPAPTGEMCCVQDCRHTINPMWERACSRKTMTRSYALPPLRSIEKPAQVWLTGISSRLLMLMCAGAFSTQKIVSAMSCG